MVQIKFTKFGANSAFGGFAPGDTMRCSEALARHLVEETGVAKYAPAAAPVEAKAADAAPAAEAPKPKKAKAK